MKIDVIIIGIVAVLSAIYALFNIFGVIGASCGIALIVIYAILLKFKPSKPQEKTFFQNIKFKLPVILMLGGIIWVMAGKFNFPVWWQIEFVSFAMVGFAFFTLLDWKNLTEEKKSSTWIKRLFITYALASGIFITVTAQLPQFDPEFELAKLNRPPVKLSGLAGPEVIAAGREVFENNKCFNCHKVFWEGNSDRGPNLGTKQIGLYSEDYIKEQILEPRKMQAPGFDDPKSVKAMPTYYGDDIDGDEMTALIAYLKTLRDPTHMPVEGKYGIPMMTGALDFRNENNVDSLKIPDPDRLDGVLLKDWPDHLWYKRVTRGVVGTPMAPWGMIFQHLYLWKAEAYARTFHDPLDKRTEKRPVPPVPTKEEMAKWKSDGLFLEPLL